MDDPERDVDAATEQPRKKQKIELESGSLMTRSVHERKLTLLHAPDSTFAAFEDHFSPIKLKQINKGVPYGKRLAVEISFWTEGDLLRALEEFNHKRFDSHYITLKFPDEALEAMEETKSGLHSLPYYLVDDILEHLTVFREGKLLKRVCRIWKESIHRAERTYPFIALSTIPMRPCVYKLEYGPPKIGEDIKHIVACPPIEYLYGLRKVFSHNAHLERLTLFGSNTLTTEAIRCVAAARELVIMNSFVQFQVNVGPDYQEMWQIGLYVPLIKFHSLFPARPGGANGPEHPAAVDEDDYGSDDSYIFDENQTEIRSKIFDSYDIADLWWPYPTEQTEWLKTSLDLLEGEQLDAIWHFLFGSNYLRLADVGENADGADNVSSSWNVGWKGIRMWGRELAKRDYAVIGGYIASLDPSLNIPPPPYEWKYIHFQATSCDKPYASRAFEEFAEGLEKFRRRARFQNVLPA